MAGMMDSHNIEAKSQKAFTSQLKKVYGFYTGGFIVFCILLGIAEQMGLSRAMMGYVFLAATVLLYAGIGIMSRTNDADEYYVAGRRVPAVFNGMATGADWMSAASFMGMAGGLYLQDYGGLAFIMGWTGGYCLVALFLAPFLRKFPVHYSRLPGCPLWRQHSTVHRRGDRHSLLLHLRGGPDLWRWTDHHPFNWRDV